MTVVGSVAFLVWAWIGMSGMDYTPASVWQGRQTAGWFVLGFPMLVGIALLSTLPFSAIARRGVPVFVGFAMAAVYGSLIWFAYVQSTPRARIARALEIEVPAEAILRLRETDSFNDGTTTVGACAADSAFVNQLIARHGLEETMIGSRMSSYLRDVEIPVYAMGYWNNRLRCYHDEDSATLYFVRRYSDPRP